MHRSKQPTTIDMDDGYTTETEEQGDTSLFDEDDDSELEEAFQTLAGSNSQFKECCAAFTRHIDHISRTRISNNPEVINRRLDSLARLLEQGNTCAAVHFDPNLNTILIATNTLFETSRENNKWTQQIERVFNFIADCELNIADLIETLAEIIHDNIIQEERFLINPHPQKQFLLDHIENLLHELFKSGMATKEWRNDRFDDSPLQDKFAGTPALYEKILKRVSRIARDFLKLRDSLHNTTRHEASAPFFSALNTKKYRIEKSQGKKVHAEMRLASYVTKSKSRTAYFGISKLCCGHCQLGIAAVNLATISQIHTRGLHGRCFNWELPEFIKENNALLARFLGEETFQIYQILSETEKALFLTAIQGEDVSAIKGITRDHKMLADSSSSDQEFGIDCGDDSDLEETAYEQALHELAELQQLRRHYSEEFSNLRDAGLSSTEILSLYNESSDKLEALAAGMESLLRSGTPPIDAFETLSKLYDQGSDDYNAFVADEQNLIHEYGLDVALEAYQEELAKKAASNNEHDEFDEPDDSDPYDRTAARLEDEHGGWSYREDSEGNYGYSSKDEGYGSSYRY